MSLTLLRRFVLALICFNALAVTGCTYTAAVSQTNVPAKRDKPVEASVYKFIVLGFSFDNDQVLQLTSKLKNKCPDGDVKGVLTQDKRIMYFLMFFWAQETTAHGYCVPTKGSGKVAERDGNLGGDVL